MPTLGLLCWSSGGKGKQRGERVVSQGVRRLLDEASCSLPPPTIRLLELAAVDLRSVLRERCRIGLFSVLFERRLVTWCRRTRRNLSFRDLRPLADEAGDELGVGFPV